VETLVAAAPAISIRLDVLSEFSEPGIRLEKDLPNAVTLDNVNYNSGATALLAAMLRQASGKALDLLAKEVLFDPLGIADVEWLRYANGNPIAGYRLRLRPRDLAKIGQLVLAGGV
jgi:CubicO group peptidase (beta-lactamase class C family)